jgi:hypothetical protein
MSYSPDIAEICRQAEEAFKRKGNLDAFWQETAELHYPERADFTSDKTLGEDFASGLYASDPVLFRRDFGNWMGAVLRPKGREWFKPIARDESINERQTVRAYLERKGLTHRRLLYDHKSQFVKASVQADHDYVTFGNCVQTCEIRRDGTGLIFRTWHLKDCAWVENYDAEIHIMFRRFKVAARDLVARERTHGWNVHTKIKEKIAQKRGDEMIPCLHVVMPMDVFDPQRPSRKRKHEWVSLYLEETNKHKMSEKEVPEFNYVVSRWFTVSGSPYAFSPTVVASIPDARTLQSMTWSVLEAGEKAVEPPLIATNEAIQGGVDISAGGITWVDQRYDERTGAALKALELGKNPQLGVALMEGLKGTLMNAWYLNRLMLPQGGPQMTAEEVARRHEEFLRAAQPIIDPAETERNGLVLDLSMGMAMRAGLWGSIDEMPKELQGKDVDLAYDNPLEDARKQSKTLAWNQTSGMIVAAKELDPTLVAHVDIHKGFRDGIAGVAPPDWLVDEDQAKQTAEQLGQEVETAGAVQEAGQGAAIASEVAKAEELSSRAAANENRKAA